MKVLALMFAVMLAGCLQQKGERCQSLNECDTGLTCVFPATPSSQTGGICEQAQTLMAVVVLYPTKRSSPISA